MHQYNNRTLIVCGTSLSNCAACLDNCLSTSTTTYPIVSLVLRYCPTILMLCCESWLLICESTPGTFLWICSTRCALLCAGSESPGMVCEPKEVPCSR